jgi:hypothetical protein
MAGAQTQDPLTAQTWLEGVKVFLRSILKSSSLKDIVTPQVRAMILSTTSCLNSGESMEK